MVLGGEGVRGMLGTASLLWQEVEKQNHSVQHLQAKG